MDRHGALEWQQLVNLLSLNMPPRCIPIESLVGWIVHHKDIYHKESMLFWCYYREYSLVGPPSRSPYALPID